MKSYQHSFLPAVVLICLLQLLQLESSDACVHKFKKYAEFSNFTKECFKQAGFKSVPSTEEIQKADFDDKCAAKCIMGALDLIDEGGRLDKDALSDYLDENTSKQTLLKLNEMSTACVDSSGSIPPQNSTSSCRSDKVTGTKQGKTADECKPIGKFYACFLAASDKLC